jgi:hypothetical protein
MQRDISLLEKNIASIRDETAWLREQIDGFAENAVICEGSDNQVARRHFARLPGVVRRTINKAPKGQNIVLPRARSYIFR